MSKKSLVLLVVTAFAMNLSLGVTMSFADDSKGPDEITLNVDGKKPVKFPHAEHQERTGCGVCHHKDVDGKRTAIEEGDAIAKCLSCHTADFPNEKLSKWKDIGHSLCKACHKKMKEEGAPTKCTGCHPKKEK